MERLEDFLDHEDPMVKDTAEQLMVLKDGLDNDDMTKDQFAELVNDLLEVEQIRHMSDTLERKIKVIQAFNIMKTLAGVLIR
jgi:hypothetical protein